MSAFVRLIAAALLSLLSLPALAVPPTGSAAWTDGGWTNFSSSLYTGPGTRYAEIGVVPGAIRVRVDRCTGLWCEIHAKNLHGWMALTNISFGTAPWKFPDPADRYPVKFGGPVCFYSGANYTGAEVCWNGGHASRDLALAGLDNSFASVKVTAGSAMVCRDRNFRSYCVIINESQPHLEGLLNRSISSVHVY